MFELTREHLQPDAIRRAVRCFNGGVEFPATIVVSLTPGFEFAPLVMKKLSGIGTIWGTHGGMRAEDSLGIYMRTDRPTADINTMEFKHEVDLSHFRDNQSREKPGEQENVPLVQAEKMNADQQHHNVQPQ